MLALQDVGAALDPLIRAADLHGPRSLGNPVPSDSKPADSDRGRSAPEAGRIEARRIDRGG